MWSRRTGVARLSAPSSPPSRTQARVSDRVLLRFSQVPTQQRRPVPEGARHALIPRGPARPGAVVAHVDRWVKGPHESPHGEGHRPREPPPPARLIPRRLSQPALAPPRYPLGNSLRVHPLPLAHREHPPAPGARPSHPGQAHTARVGDTPRKPHCSAALTDGGRTPRREARRASRRLIVQLPAGDHPARDGNGSWGAPLSSVHTGLLVSAPLFPCRPGLLHVPAVRHAGPQSCGLTAKTCPLKKNPFPYGGKLGRTRGAADTGWKGLGQPPAQRPGSRL